jgi:phosphatidylethanolamine-binding protein
LAPPDLPQGSYAIIAIDLDPPFVSFNILGPGAHWVQTGFTISEQPNRELKSDDPAIAYWAAAAPPPGAAPHRYVFFLYEQTPDTSIPPNYKEKPFSLSQRVRFDVDGMVKQLKLGEIKAANYFLSN